MSVRGRKTVSPRSIGSSAASAPASAMEGTNLTSIPRAWRAAFVAVPTAAQRGPERSTLRRSAASRTGSTALPLVIAIHDAPAARATAASSSPPASTGRISIVGIATTSSPSAASALMSGAEGAAGGARGLGRAGGRGTEDDLVALDRCQGADRGPAATAGRPEELPLGLDGGAGRRVVKSGEPGAGDVVVGPALDREGALAGRRRAELARQDLPDPIGPPEPDETRHGEDERIGRALVEPAEAGGDVAVERGGAGGWPHGAGGG